jgi:DNA-binding protein Fis
VNSLNERIRSRGDGASATLSQTTLFAPMSLQAMEKRLISCVLEHAKGNRTRAAEILGISREGLRTKLQRLQIPDASESSS